MMTAMRTLMSADVWVHYGQIYAGSGDEFPGLSESFGGQQNGLCGAAIPGHLFLITGLHTGHVGFAVELHDKEPAVDDDWEEIVEVSFQPTGKTALAQWGGEAHWPLDLPEGSYRVRYCGTWMDEANSPSVEKDAVIDRYLLQFWPSPPQPDRIVKQTSAVAAYWHGTAQHQPPPPTPEEKAEAARRAQLEAERASLEAEKRKWGGWLPSERVRQLAGNAKAAARMDPLLADAIAATDATTQRDIARWVVRRAHTEARLTDIDWIAAALTAMDNGAPLPPPFDDPRRARDRVNSDERIPRTMVTAPDGRGGEYLQQAMAVPIVLMSQEEDPLVAALSAIWAGVHVFGRERYGLLLAEIREVFGL